jgi:putative phage-type endonuclease
MIKQGTPEWHKQRLGKVTASKIADLMARTKSGPSASRANYAAQLIAERLTGNPTESFTNAAMQHGTDTEPQARAAYSFETDCAVTEAEFIPHPTIGMSGCSPDGFVNDDGMIEIKCPNTATHLETLLGEEIEGKYIKQMQWQMACTGRKWCDFVSFDPRLPVELQLKIQRVNRDNEMIAAMEKEVVIFLNEIDAKVDALKALIKGPTHEEDTGTFEAELAPIYIRKEYAAQNGAC